jgi:hypothetical protein
MHIKLMSYMTHIGLSPQPLVASATSLILTKRQNLFW